MLSAPSLLIYTFLHTVPRLFIVCLVSCLPTLPWDLDGNVPNLGKAL
jgi:hypothetical protein